MTDVAQVGYMEWEGTSAGELGYGDDVQQTDHRYHAENDQIFNLFEADARRSESDPTIIVPASHKYRIDDLLRRRMSIFAHHTNSQVIAVETPGMTMNQSDFDADVYSKVHTDGAFMTPAQKLASLIGDFSDIADTQIEAINEVIGFHKGQEVQIFGESMGVVLAAFAWRGLRRAQLGVSVSRLGLFEPVNALGFRTPVHQALMIRDLVKHEVPNIRNNYFPENDEIGHGDVGAFEDSSDRAAQISRVLNRQQRLNGFLTGFALKRSLAALVVDGLKETADYGEGLRDTAITLWRATHSTVSRATDVDKAGEAIQDAGGDVRVVELVEGKSDRTKVVAHHTNNSLGRQASFAINYLNLA